MDFVLFLTKFGHYAAAFLAMTLSALGAALGQGYAFKGAEEAMSRQSESAKIVKQLQFVGLLLIESGPALGLILVILFLTRDGSTLTPPEALAEIGVGLGFGISALASGIAAGSAIAAATHAVARQPFAVKKLSTLMLLLESFAEISLIFSFIIGILIRARISPTLEMPEAIKLVATALTLSLATIGIGIGQSMLAKTNIAAVGLNQSMYGKIATFTFLTSAFIETPLFFAFFVAIKMLFSSTATLSCVDALAFFGATLSSGLGSAGPAIGAAYISGKSIVEATLDPSQYDSLRKTATASQVILESGAAYALLISLVIITSIG